MKKPQGNGENKTNTEGLKIDSAKIKKYSRGVRVKTKATKDRKLQKKLRSTENKYELAIKQAARSEFLLTEESGYLEAEGNERTHKFQQAEIVESLDVTSGSKYFNLHLNDFGPYKINYTRNGKFLLIGGQRGHLASFDWQAKQLASEVHAQEAVRDVCWLHQDTFFAAAQKKYVHIYDRHGVEIHCLKNHYEVNRLEYLPYHFLLASVGNSGHLKYQDTSTGKPVADIKTKYGRCDCMVHNKYNAIINLGHHKGTVTMWSPMVKEPLVNMLCHRGPVLSIAVEKQGVYMATSGLDGLMKVWDIRSYKPIYKYKMHGRPAHCLAISQKGMLAAAFGSRIHVFREALSEKQNMPYMTHNIPGADISSIEFCPYEDVLGVGHSKGFTSLLVPGSGEPNFDAFEANPYEGKRQKREHEVKMLLDKIQPEMISLNPSAILNIDTADAHTRKDERDEGKEVEHFEPKYKMKGRSSSSKVIQRKKGVTELSKREKLKENMRSQKGKEQSKKPKSTPVYKSALDRFGKKSL